MYIYIYLRGRNKIPFAGGKYWKNSCTRSFPFPPQFLDLILPLDNAFATAFATDGFSAMQSTRATLGAWVVVTAAPPSLPPLGTAGIAGPSVSPLLPTLASNPWPSTVPPRGMYKSIDAAATAAFSRVARITACFAASLASALGSCSTSRTTVSSWDSSTLHDPCYHTDHTHLKPL